MSSKGINVCSSVETEQQRQHQRRIAWQANACKHVWQNRWRCQFAQRNYGTTHAIHTHADWKNSFKRKNKNGKKQNRDHHTTTVVGIFTAEIRTTSWAVTQNDCSLAICRTAQVNRRFKLNSKTMVNSKLRSFRSPEVDLLSGRVDHFVFAISKFFRCGENGGSQTTEGYRYWWN